MNEKVILKAENIYYTYPDGTKALRGIDLEIKKGHKIALLGANGSGKSTFFLCMNGIHRPQEGSMYFDGKPFDYTKKGLLQLRSKVGIVFQDPDNQLFSASVYQEIAFGILNLGADKNTAMKAVNQVIQDLEITPFKDKPTHFLSGGQKKQVSIADILVMNPEVIVLDEPSAALDPKHTIMVNRFMDQLADKGITVIISTHDVDYAYEWADDIVLFSKGKILCTGTPEEVFSRRDLLAATNLKTPVALELFERLCQKKILSSALPLPRSLLQLEDYLEIIHETGGNPHE